MKFGLKATLYKKISRRYSRAFFNSAVEQKAIEQTQLDMVYLSETLRLSPEFADFIEASYLPQASIKKMLEELFGGRITPLTVDFLDLLVKRGRLNLLPEVISAFESLYHQYHGITKIQIISAEKIEPEQVERICAKLEERWKRGIFAETVIDPELIGGFKIKSGDRVLDFSLKNQLEIYRQHVINA